MVIEGGSTVPWTKPEDLPYVPLGKLPALGGAFKDCIHAALGDGSVQTFKKNFDEKSMRLAITRNDGEVFNMSDLIDPAPGTDAKTLKQENDDLRIQIEKAHEELIALTKKLRAAALKSAGEQDDNPKDGEDAQLTALKREHQLLQQELDRLESQIKEIKRAMEQGATREKRTPTRKK
jgi:hypothetical protein